MYCECVFHLCEIIFCHTIYTIFSLIFSIVFYVSTFFIAIKLLFNTQITLLVCNISHHKSQFMLQCSQAFLLRCTLMSVWI